MLPCTIEWRHLWWNLDLMPSIMATLWWTLLPWGVALGLVAMLWGKQVIALSSKMAWRWLLSWNGNDERWCMEVQNGMAKMVQNYEAASKIVWHCLVPENCEAVRRPLAPHNGELQGDALHRHGPCCANVLRGPYPPPFPPLGAGSHPQIVPLMLTVLPTPSGQERLRTASRSWGISHAHATGVRPPFRVRESATDLDSVLRWGRKERRR